MAYSRARWLGVPLLALSLLLATFPMLAWPAPASAHAQAAAEVQVVDFAFEPGTLTVPVGTTVTWTNAGNRPHTVTSDDDTFDSGRLDPGETFSQTFDLAGTFAYHCGFHPEMQGAIVVTEAAPEAIDVATPPPAEETTATTGDEASTAGPSRNLTPLDSPRLAHIHAGTCEELGIVVYSLPDLQSYRVDAGEEDGVGVVELISGTAQVPLSGLFGEPFSIHIHASPTNKQTYIACADVGGQPAAPWTEANGLVLATEEQDDSGYSGLTTLRPAADGGTQVSVVLAASSAATEAAASQPPPPPSATYTSPTFGYTIGYGSTWEESENRSANGRDRFVLSNDTSFITFTGVRDFAGDPQACVDAFVTQLTADPNVSNLGLAVDDQGEPLEGGTEATGAFAIYNHDYQFADHVEPYTLFVDCVPLIPNEAVLAIVQNVPTAEFNDQVEARAALLRGLTLPQ